jgi:hypothetical protein
MRMVILQLNVRADPAVPVLSEVAVEAERL